MDKRATQLRNKTEYQLAHIRDMEDKIRKAKDAIAHMEVEYEELTGLLLLTRDRKRVAPLS